MDHWEDKHLKVWLERTIAEEDRDDVESLIRKYVADHPEVLVRNSRPEIRIYAEKEQAERKGLNVRHTRTGT